MTKKLFALFAVLVSANIASAGDVRSDLATALWTNMQDIPDALVRSKDTAKFTDLQACYYAGAHSQKVIDGLFRILIRPDFQSLQNTMGTPAFYEVVELETALQNLATGLGNHCGSNVDRAAITADLIKIYRGHLAAYRILDPTDISRANENVSRLDFLSAGEKMQILVPVTNTGELGDFNPQPISY